MSDTPTAEAMKAATALWTEAVDWDNEDADGRTLPYLREHTAALVIDRETNLPALLARVAVLEQTLNDTRTMWRIANENAIAHQGFAKKAEGLRQEACARLAALEASPDIVAYVALKDRLNAAEREADALRKENEEMRCEIAARAAVLATQSRDTHVEALTEHRDALKAEVGRLRDLLALVLPMAKGYAAAHPVGRNAEMIAEVETALANPS